MSDEDEADLAAYLCECEPIRRDELIEIAARMEAQGLVYGKDWHFEE